MKNLKIFNNLFLIAFTLLCIFIFNINSRALQIETSTKENYLVNVQYRLASPAGEDEDCSPYFTQDLIDLLQDVFDVIKFVDVVMVVVLTIVTFTQAIAKGGDDLKKAVNITLKRVIIGVAVFFIPTLINFIFKTVGLYGTCGIR